MIYFGCAVVAVAVTLLARWRSRMVVVVGVAMAGAGVALILTQSHDTRPAADESRTVAGLCDRIANHVVDAAMLIELARARDAAAITSELRAQYKRAVLLLQDSAAACQLQKSCSENLEQSDPMSAEFFPQVQYVTARAKAHEPCAPRVPPE